MQYFINDVLWIPNSALYNDITVTDVTLSACVHSAGVTTQVVEY